MMAHPKETTVPTDQPETPASQTIDETLLRILVCPVDRGQLRAEATELVCATCGRRYPVEDGIPNMLVDPA